MHYRITPSVKDASPIDIMGDHDDVIEELVDMVLEELFEDVGVPFGPGFTLTIERIS